MGLPVSRTIRTVSPLSFAATGASRTGCTRVRDPDFDEDRAQIRTAVGAQIMASLRNLVITILRPASYASIAAALRRHHARRPLQTIMMS